MLKSTQVSPEASSDTVTDATVPQGGQCAKPQAQTMN